MPGNGFFNQQNRDFIPYGIDNLAVGALKPLCAICRHLAQVMFALGTDNNFQQFFQIHIQTHLPHKAKRGAEGISSSSGIKTFWMPADLGATCHG